MNQAEKKFRLSAVLAVFILLTVLLTVINGTNFTMVSQDADRITQMLADRQGAFAPRGGAAGAAEGQFKPDGRRMGPMGPSSPEVNASVRYFTFAFSKAGDKTETVAFQLSAVTEAEAEEWARSLVKETTGWTRGTYRYRVYEKGDRTFVTVIDQGRELLPSYRILIISAIGDVLCVIIAWFVLKSVGKKLFSPLEEADRKQKQFIASANREFRLPLTVISGDTELLERAHGPDERTSSIRRQVSKLDALVEKLGRMGVFEEDAPAEQVSLSETLCASLDEANERFAQRGLTVQSDIAPDIVISASPEAIKKVTDELVENALQYAGNRAAFTLKREGVRTVLEARNDADLPDGPVDQVFDRFTTLENAADGAHDGLGLSYVKQIARACNGRVSAEVKGGEFILRISI